MSPKPSPTLKRSPRRLRRWRRLRPGVLWIVLLLLAGLAGPACAGPQDEEPEATETAAEQPPEDEKEGGDVSEEEAKEEKLAPPLDELAAAATSALAEKLEIDESEITLVEAEKVVWRNGSLGCPEPEMMYMQMLVDGARLVLEAQGEKYHYHSNLTGPPRYCENPDPGGAMPPGEGGEAPM